MVVTMGDGAKFEVTSTLSFKEAVADLVQPDCALCQISPEVVVNAFQIAYIEDITYADIKALPVHCGGGSPYSS